MKINLVVGLSQSWMIISVLRHVFCEISTMIVLSFKTCATIENKKVLLEYSYTVLVSLVQFIGIIHNICKVWGSNLGHHKNKKKYSYTTRDGGIGDVELQFTCKKKIIFYDVMHAPKIRKNLHFVLLLNKIEFTQT